MTGAISTHTTGIAMSDLGDLTGFLREGAVADLDWLDVNEEDYRKLDQLPKQNLDIAPDLQAVWSHEDKPADKFVPNKQAPKTMLDVGQQKVASETIEAVGKVARFALMQSPDLRHFQHALLSRFDKHTLREARAVLADALAERGLLGKWYIDGRDFHACDRHSKKSAEFVRRYASEAKYILAKADCEGCTHNAGNMCSVFHKQIVLDVPYSDALAEALERSKAASGRVVASTGGNARERIRAALLASEAKLTSVQAPKPVENTVRNLRPVEASPKKVHLPVLTASTEKFARAEQAWQPSASEGRTASLKVAADKKAFEVAAVLRREMLKGRSEMELIQALKLSFSTEDLQNTRPQWEPLYKEAGYFGTIYSTQDSFDDCHSGADFLAKHNSPVKGIVSGDKCNGCIYNKLARCMLYGRPLVASKEDLYTSETVQQVIREQRLSGKLETGAEKVAWGESPEEALKNIYRVASATYRNQPTRAVVERAFSGYSHGHVTAGLTKRQIVKTARRYLNEGLYGKQLIEALKRQYDPRDIVAAKEDLRPVIAEQGLQGIYYVDPTVYDDYGKGCHEAERLHRSRLVAYVKTGSACGSCVHQIHGRCSKLGGKELVAEPPYVDKAAQQREILASGQSTEVRYDQLVNNGRSMLAEFNMQAEMAVDLDPVPTKGPSLDVEIGTGKVKL